LYQCGEIKRLYFLFIEKELLKVLIISASATESEQASAKHGHEIVQVTKDGCPVIFHDNFIYTQQDVSLSIALFKCPTAI